MMLSITRTLVESGLSYISLHTNLATLEFEEKVSSICNTQNAGNYNLYRPAWVPSLVSKSIQGGGVAKPAWAMIHKTTTLCSETCNISVTLWRKLIYNYIYL